MHVCKTNGDVPVFWRHSVVLKLKCPALSIKKTKNRGPKTCWHSRSLLLLPWNCYWSGLEKSALTVPVNHHLQQAKNAPGPSVLISPVSFQNGQRLQFPQNIYQDFKIILFTMSHYFAAQPFQRKKKKKILTTATGVHQGLHPSTPLAPMSLVVAQSCCQ